MVSVTTATTTNSNNTKDYLLSFLYKRWILNFCGVLFVIFALFLSMQMNNNNSGGGGGGGGGNKPSSSSSSSSSKASTSSSSMREGGKSTNKKKKKNSLVLSYEEKQDKLTVKKALKEEYDICIIGAGLSGAVIAERYANTLNKKVLVLEKRNHIGGNCYDYVEDDTGIRVSKYGAHLFHTKYDRVWDYIQKFSPWTKYEHRVLGIVNGIHVPIPVNIDTVNKLFNLTIKDSNEMDKWLEKEQTKYDHEPKNSEEMAKSRVGPRLYDLIFKPYTIKQWAKTPAELGPEVTARIPVRNDHNDLYFPTDKHQALPSNGYTHIFENMFDHDDITVLLNTDYFDMKSKIKCKGRTYFTGPIDAYFAHLGWEKLEYRSIDFERQVHKTKGYYQPISVVNHPGSQYNFTRIVEYKHLLNQSSDYTTIFIERSKDTGEPYYPVPNPKNQELFDKYKKMANKEKDVTFVGRLANYKYFNMDQTIKNALELFDMDTKGKIDDPTDAGKDGQSDQFSLK